MRKSFLSAFFVLISSVAFAGGFQDGRWRLDLSALSAFDCDDADGLFMGSVEYEFPAYPHGKLGLKLIPVFVGTGDDNIYGAGLGIATRAYARREATYGFFGEVGISALYQTTCFHGNDSRVNFITEAGIGYKFESQWHVAIKAQHISNAGLCEDNSGVNGVGISAGFTF